MSNPNDRIELTAYENAIFREAARFATAECERDHAEEITVLRNELDAEHAREAYYEATMPARKVYNEARALVFARVAAL